MRGSTSRAKLQLRYPPVRRRSQRHQTLKLTVLCHSVCPIILAANAHQVSRVRDLFPLRYYMFCPIGKSHSQTLKCTPRRGCKYLNICPRSRSQSFTTLPPFLIELTGSLFPRQCITGSSAPATGPFEYQAVCDLNSSTIKRPVVLIICDGLCIADV